MASGFTLVELLVVLVISALAVTLLGVIGGQVQQADARLRDQRYQVSRGAHVDALFANVIEGLALEFPGSPVDSPRRFRGDATAISGFSTGALLGEAATPRTFEMELRLEPGGATALVYREPASSGSGPAPELVIERFEEAVKFEYADGEGRLHARWPAESASPRQLPASIRLVSAAGTGQGMYIVAAPRMTALPERDMFGF